MVAVETWKVTCGWNPEFFFNSDEDAFKFAQTALEALDKGEVMVERIEKVISGEVSENGENALEEA